MVQLESAINPPTGPSKASGHLVGALVNCQLGDKHENLSLPLKHFSLHHTVFNSLSRPSVDNASRAKQSCGPSPIVRLKNCSSLNFIKDPAGNFWLPLGGAQEAIATLLQTPVHPKSVPWLTLLLVILVIRTFAPFHPLIFHRLQAISLRRIVKAFQKGSFTVYTAIF